MSNWLIARNRNYRLLFSGSLSSNLADGISVVALPWLATILSEDPVMIAMVAAAQRLPWFLFALPIGVLTDRADRRLLMVRADLMRALLMGATLMLTLGADSAEPSASAIWALALIALLFGTAEVIRDNAAQTLLPSIVASKDLERANGQMWSGEQITNLFIGPPLAGFLIAGGLALPFAIDASIYALTALLIWMMVIPARPKVDHERFWQALRDGITWMRAHSTILRLAIMLGLINAIFVGGLTILVLYAQDILQLSAGGYGLLLTSGAVGGVIGGLISPRVAKYLGPRNSLLLALALFILPHLLLGYTSSTSFAALALFVESLSGMLWNVVTVSYRQRHIPDDLLGRVNSIYRFFGWGSMPLGAMAAGTLVKLSEPTLGREAALHLPYQTGSVILVLLLIYGALRLRIE